MIIMNLLTSKDATKLGLLFDTPAFVIYASLTKGKDSARLTLAK